MFFFSSTLTGEEVCQKYRIILKTTKYPQRYSAGSRKWIGSAASWSCLENNEVLTVHFLLIFLHLRWRILHKEQSRGYDFFVDNMLLPCHSHWCVVVVESPFYCFLCLELPFQFIPKLPSNSDSSLHKYNYEKQGKSSCSWKWWRMFLNLFKTIKLEKYSSNVSYNLQISFIQAICKKVSFTNK